MNRVTKVVPNCKPRVKQVVAACVINKKEEILLLRRIKNRPRAPGVWHCMTGSVEPGEPIETALHRELKEELALTEFTVVKKGLPFRDKETFPGEIFEVHSFLIHTVQSICVDKEEHDAWKWLRPSEICKIQGVHPALARNLAPLGIIVLENR